MRTLITLAVLAAGCGSPTAPDPVETACDCVLSPELAEREIEEHIGRLRGEVAQTFFVAADVAFSYRLPVEDGAERWAVSCDLTYTPKRTRPDALRQEAFLVLALRNGDWGLEDVNLSKAVEY